LERALVFSVQTKVLETVELTEHLTTLAPEKLLTWSPTAIPNSSAPTDLGHLLGHLLDCMAGFCAAFLAAFPDGLTDFAQLKALPVNQFCAPAEALARMNTYKVSIARGFACCADADLSRKIKTIFAPEGETLLTLLLGNLEHLINHKYQLFFYLKIAGIPVSSRELYKWHRALQS